MKHLLISIVATILLSSFVGHSSYGAITKELKVDNDSAVEFLAIGNPSLLKIRGKGAKASGKLALDVGKLSGEILVDLTPIDTGMSLRNRHMHEKYLETNEHPHAKLSLDAIKLPEEDFGEKEFAFTGKLTVKGVEKSIQGTAIISKSEEKLTATAKFKFKISEFGIDIPSFAGVTVADEVLVESTLIAKKE